MSVTPSQDITVDRLQESTTNPRHHFDETALAELSRSIKEHGVLTPLLVRPIGGGRSEIVSGARRFRAAKLAGLISVPTLSMSLSEEQACEIQIIDNLQREDVHPLDEAMGYKQLIKKLHYDTAKIVTAVGKSETYIRQRFKLCDLVPRAQKAFWDGKIQLAHAIQICRLQARDQEEILKSTIEQQSSPGHLRDEIDRRYHLDLKKAPFPKNDAKLVAQAGSCVECPKRTGFAASLFPDIQNHDTCTDPGCFQRKLAAFLASKREDLTKLPGPKPVNVSTEWNNYGREKLPKETLFVNNYRRLKDKDDECESARNGLIVHGDHIGHTLRICSDEKCKKHHPGRSMTPQERASNKRQREKTKLQAAIRETTIDAIVGKVTKDLTTTEVLVILESVLHRALTDTQRELCAYYELEPVKQQYGRDFQKPLLTMACKTTASQLNQMLMACALFQSPDELPHTAKTFLVDMKAIEKRCREELARPKVRAKKSSSCKYCGCTESTPCQTTKGPCAWANKEKTVCTASLCVKKHLAELFAASGKAKKVRAKKKR